MAAEIKRDVVEHDALHWIGVVSQNHARAEPRRMDLDIFECDVFERNTALRWTLAERIL